MVITEGRLFWMQDAYTTSAWFPYAAPVPHGDLDYIRNSVKIAIDAYNGTVTFYLTDPADPVAATYQRIFPELFKPFAAMPTDLRRHVRYPEDLFLIQADMHRAYHMDAPEGESVCRAPPFCSGRRSCAGFLVLERPRPGIFHFDRGAVEYLRADQPDHAATDRVDSDGRMQKQTNIAVIAGSPKPHLLAAWLGKLNSVVS